MLIVVNCYHAHISSSAKKNIFIKATIAIVNISILIMMMVLRAIVVHAGVDDLGQGGASDSLTTGNAGARFVLIMRMNIVFNDDIIKNLKAV